MRNLMCESACYISRTVAWLIRLQILLLLLTLDLSATRSIGVILATVCEVSWSSSIAIAKLVLLLRLRLGVLELALGTEREDWLREGGGSGGVLSVVGRRWVPEVQKQALRLALVIVPIACHSCSGYWW